MPCKARRSVGLESAGDCTVLGRSRLGSRSKKPMLRFLLLWACVFVLLNGRYRRGPLVVVYHDVNGNRIQEDQLRFGLPVLWLTYTPVDPTRPDTQPPGVVQAQRPWRGMKIDFAKLALDVLAAGGISAAVWFIRRPWRPNPSIAGLLAGFSIGVCLGIVAQHMSTPRAPVLVFSALLAGVIVVNWSCATLLRVPETSLLVTAAYWCSIRLANLGRSGGKFYDAEWMDGIQVVGIAALLSAATITALLVRNTVRRRFKKQDRSI